MGRTRQELMAELPPERREKIEARVAEAIEEIETLADVRKLAGKTQAQIAAQLGKKQPSIQKMEKQTDLMISTFQRFVEAAGGSIEIRVNLPGRAPVVLRQFSELKADT